MIDAAMPSVYTILDNAAFLDACQRGSISIVNECIRIKNPDDGFDFNYAIFLASEHGHADVVAALLQSGRINSPAHCTRAFYRACQHGFLDVVKLLVNNAFIDSRGRAFEVAVEKNHVQIVECLLYYGRVDMDVYRDTALTMAVAAGSLELVELFLKDYRFRPHGNDNAAINLAQAKGSDAIFNRLRQDVRIAAMLPRDHYFLTK